jgi:hypothetical protein
MSAGLTALGSAAHGDLSGKLAVAATSPIKPLQTAANSVQSGNGKAVNRNELAIWS